MYSENSTWLVYADNVPDLLHTCSDEINPFIVNTWEYLIDFALVLPVSNSRYALPYLNYITATFLTLFRHFWGNRPPTLPSEYTIQKMIFLWFFRGVFTWNLRRYQHSNPYCLWIKLKQLNTHSNR